MVKATGHIQGQGQIALAGQTLIRARPNRLSGQMLSYFDDVFKDHSIDIRTGELLGRDVTEELDTCRLLWGCYERLVAQRDAA
jgi:hypothetical protein